MASFCLQPLDSFNSTTGSVRREHSNSLGLLRLAEENEVKDVSTLMYCLGEEVDPVLSSKTGKDGVQDRSISIQV